MDHDIVPVKLDLPEPYASALEYAALQLSLTQSEMVVLLLQLACSAEVHGELTRIGKELYNWLTIIKQVPTEEVWVERV